MPAAPYIADDIQLIHSIRAGGLDGHRATNALYDRFAYFVKSGMFKHKLSEDDAITAYNQSILAMVEAIKVEKFRGDSTIKTYLHQVFFRQCVNVIRKNTTKEKYEWVAEVPHYPDRASDIMRQIIEQEEVDRLKLALQSLSEKCRKILWGSAYFGYSSQEIAEQTGLKNADTVNVQKNRCRKQLIKIMNTSTD